MQFNQEYSHRHNCWQLAKRVNNGYLFARFKTACMRGCELWVFLKVAILRVRHFLSSCKLEVIFTCLWATLVELSQYSRVFGGHIRSFPMSRSSNTFPDSSAFLITAQRWLAIRQKQKERCSISSRRQLYEK